MQLKQVQSDAFFIDLPIGTSEVEKSTDGLHYYVEYKMPNGQGVYVKAFPWIKTPEEAMAIADHKYGGTDFDYNIISGIKWADDHGEVFSFNKDGYTVVISSYGYWNYLTIRDIARSIKFRLPPMTKEQKAKAFAPVRIAKILSKQMKQALNTCGGDRIICDSTKWALELDIEDNTNPPVIHIGCWLSSYAIELLRNHRCLNIVGNELNLVPIAESLQMREDSLFSLKFDYFDENGNYLKIGDEENE